MSQENKELVRKFYEAIDNGNTAAIGQLCTPTATFQVGSTPASPVDEFTRTVSSFADGSSRHVIQDLIAEGDKVACHVNVVRRTDGGESITTALTLFTVAGGRIAGELVLLDRG